MNSEATTSTPELGSVTAGTEPVTAVATEVKEQPLPAKPSSPPAVRIFGIGEAGTNVLDLLIRQGFAPEICVAMNSHAESLARSAASEKLSIDARQGRGIGCCGDAERGRTGAEGCEVEIAALCKDARAIIIVAGLGGGAGTGAAPVVARIARDAGALTIALAALPLRREGILRLRNAESGLADLRKQADLVLPFDNERAISPNAPLLATYNQPNEMLACSVRSLANGLTAGSVLGLPLSDICVLMRDRAEDCVLASAESSGADRASVAGEKILAHPCLDGGAATLAEAEAVAICVVGGSSLAISEVNKVVDFTSKESASAPFIMGASIQPSMQETLSVLLLVGRTRDPKQDLRRSLPEEPQPAWQNDAPVIEPTGRPKSRLVPPPPEISPERARQIAGQGRSRKSVSRMRQAQLQLDIISRGRFDKSEPTIHKGEDLDIPTYVRRGVSLN